jgi:arabinan endo-1,5-alpha-L-arabinosidase
VDGSGKWWLTFGSFWSGIKQVALSSATGKRSDSTLRGIAGRNGGAIEAPFVFRHGSYYYLWVSFDLCCRGAASTYRIMVGRSTGPNGPFVDRGGAELTAGAVIADTDGDVLVYHYYADNGASFLGINLIAYDAAGWPFLY